MKKITKYLSILLVVFSAQVLTAESYNPDSGDAEIDASLIALNNKIKNKTGQFSQLLAAEFQVPEEQVVVLFTHYEFTPADVLMTLTIADSSGQPVTRVARTYFDNRESGWEYTLYQMKISKSSAIFNQIKQDTKAEYSLD